MTISSTPIRANTAAKNMTIFNLASLIGVAFGGGGGSSCGLGYGVLYGSTGSP